MASRLPPIARPLSPMAILPSPRLKVNDFPSRGFNERPGTFPSSRTRQVVRLNDRADVHRWTVAEMDRRQQKFEVIDGVFDRFRDDSSR